MKQIRFFVEAFKKRFPEIRVEWMDERFTSKMAMDAMVAGGMKKSDRRVKGNIDKVSACTDPAIFSGTKKQSQHLGVN